MRRHRFHAELAISLACVLGVLSPRLSLGTQREFPSRAGLLNHAQSALAALPSHYALSLHTRHDGGPFHAWQRFVAVSSFAEYVSVSGDNRFFSFSQSLLADRRGLDGNDDSLWVAEADLDMAPLKKEEADRQRTVQDAETIFKQLAAQYWDTTCGGGIWWDHARTYKNAITNELFLDVAARLYILTGEPSYKSWAERSWNWFAASGMISPSYAINDGLDKTCHNNAGPPYSYNQGVILDALLSLATVTGNKTLQDEAIHIADETITARAPQGNGFTEPQIAMTVDSQIFRGIFVRAFGHLVQSLPPGQTRAHFSSWLQDESQTVWNHRFQNSRFNATWEKSPQRPSAQAQITAANLFIAAANMSDNAAP